MPLMSDENRPSTGLRLQNRVLAAVQRFGGTTSGEPEPTDAGSFLPIEEPYEAYIEDCRKRRLPQIVVNASPAHARIAIRHLLILAHETNQDVRILTGKLNAETYSPLVNEVAEVLRLQRRVYILAASEIDQPERNDFFRTVGNSEFGEVRIFGKSPNRTDHFQLIGDVAYRVELDDDTKEAYVCFNDKNKIITDLLRTTFDRKWLKSAGKAAEPFGGNIADGGDRPVG